MWNFSGVAATEEALPKPIAYGRRGVDEEDLPCLAVTDSSSKACSAARLLSVSYSPPSEVALVASPSVDSWQRIRVPALGPPMPLACVSLFLSRSPPTLELIAVVSSVGVTSSLATTFELSTSPLSESDARATSGKLRGLCCVDGEDDNDEDKEVRLEGGDGCGTSDGRDLGCSAIGGPG